MHEKGPKMKFRYYDEDIPEYTLGVVFVFGSNCQGIHDKGAAKFAKEYYGALDGAFMGRFNDSYAIPTKLTPYKSLELSQVKEYIEAFIDHTYECEDDYFLVTKVGCGLAGFTNEQIAPLFREANNNCYFHKDWLPYLENLRIPK